MLPNFRSGAASAVQSMNWLLKTGRHRNDKDVILPAWKFSTLTLKITTSFTDSGTIGFATSETNAKIEVSARYLVPPPGDKLINTPFLKKIEHFNSTLATVQEENIKMPVGSGNGAYRRIMIYAREAAIADGVDIDKYELVVNGSEQIVKTTWELSQQEDSERYGANSNGSMRAFISNTDTVDLGYQPSSVAGNLVAEDDELLSFTSIAGDRVTAELVDDAGSDSTTDRQASLVWTAPGVSFCTMIDLGTDDIADCLPVGLGSGISTLDLKVNVAAAGALTIVMGEQLVRL